MFINQSSRKLKHNELNMCMILTIRDNSDNENITTTICPHEDWKLISCNRQPIPKPELSILDQRIRFPLKFPHMSTIETEKMLFQSQFEVTINTNDDNSEKTSINNYFELMDLAHFMKNIRKFIKTNSKKINLWQWQWW